MNRVRDLFERARKDDLIVIEGSFSIHIYTRWRESNVDSPPMVFLQRAKSSEQRKAKGRSCGVETQEN